MIEGKSTILVVDDEEQVRKLMRRILEESGYDVDTAANGNEALDKISEHSPELVLLDIKMPGKSGVEVLHELRTSHPDTAVIMATAVGDVNVAINTIRDGAYDYLTKPFNANEMVITVERALERQRLIQENRDYQLNLERKVAEQTQLLQQQLRELQAIIQELQAFAYTISHDLRGPLVTIQSFARMLRADLEEKETGRVDEDIRSIESGITKMQRLLKGILEYARIGRVVEPTENVPFREIVDETLQQLAEQVGASGASISLAETFPTVYADRTRMVQVLNNLVQNSTEYRDKNRPLTIEIGHSLSGGEVVFFVRDNGIGIKPDTLKRVPQLFYRGDRESRGTGAGLAIVKRVIEAHGGRMWIESEVGKGTTVYFTLPGKATGETHQGRRSAQEAP